MTKSLPIAIFIPTRNEARGIFKYLKIQSKTSEGLTKIYQAKTKLRNHDILLVLTGIGPQLAKLAIETVLENYSPKEIWLLGVCGATQIGYEAGDAFIAQEMISEKASKPLLKTSSYLHDQASRIFTKSSQRVHSGKLLTVDRIVEGPPEKIALGKAHDCLALEMEAYPIAEAAQRKNVPFIQIRWVLDPAEYEVPPTQKFVDSQGEAKAFAAIKTFVQNPSLTFQMIPFIQKVQNALKNMNEFLHSFLEDGTM